MSGLTRRRVGSGVACWHQGLEGSLPSCGWCVLEGACPHITPCHAMPPCTYGTVLQYYGETGQLVDTPVPQALERDKDPRLAASPLRFPGATPVQVEGRQSGCEELRCWCWAAHPPGRLACSGATFETLVMPPSPCVSQASNHITPSPAAPRLPSRQGCLRPGGRAPVHFRLVQQPPGHHRPAGPVYGSGGQGTRGAGG